jgi:hypothetical protein
MHIEEDTQMLVTEEIEMLKVYCIWQQAGEGRIRSVYAKSLWDVLSTSQY